MTILAARLLLTGMFALAAVAKLADRDGARKAVTAFGVPAAAAPITAPALIAGEFGIAALLVEEPRGGAVAALVALAGFSAVVLASLARGHRVECHCFGRFSGRPLGWSTLARNGFFAALATVIALNESPWPLTTFAIITLTLWLGPAARHWWTSRAGTKAADLALPDRAGRIWTLEQLQSHVPLVLVFSLPGCGACEALLPEVAQWQRDLDGRVTVALVNGGPPSNGVPWELIDENRTSFAAYGITATPSAVLIDAGRRQEMAQGAAAIGELVNRAAGVPARTAFSRRRVLSVLPAVAATAAACDEGGKSGKPSNANAFEVDGAWLCNQTFALCTTAPCVPSPTDPGISVCDCVVVNGYSVGFKSCTDRAQTGNKVRSAFSTVNVNANFGVLRCPSGVPWANCLDVECEIDATNPAVAKCQCLTVKTGESLTFGGGCNTATCTQTVWSAATPDLPATTQYRKGMSQIGQPVDFPKACPAPHP